MPPARAFGRLGNVQAYLPLLRRTSSVKPWLLASLEPADADVSAVAEAIVRIVDMPFGRRPFRTHIDPSQDGAEIVNGVADRVRAELFRRIGLQDLLSPRGVR
jgi:hypothetical protein